MKKLWIIVLPLLLGLAGLRAQSVDNYKFTSNIGTYTALTGGTALNMIPAVKDSNVAKYIYDATTVVALPEEQEAKTIAGIDMGFEFELGGKKYGKFAVMGYGYIVLGEAGSPIAFNARDFYNCRMEGVSAAVGIATDLPVYDLKVSYAITGDAGDKVLTVQFADINYDSSNATDHMDYQIKLYEADKHIEMSFGGYGGVEDMWGKYNVGVAADGYYHFRRPSSNDWNQSTFNSSTTSTTWSVPEIQLGLTYTFALPDPCAAPTYTVQNITLTPSSDRMAIAVDVDTTGKYADEYMVVYSTSPIEGKPADGSAFRKGESVLGGTVLATGEMSSWDPNRTNPDRSRAHMTFDHPSSQYESLQPNTLYYYAVYFANTKGCISAYSEPALKSESTATTAPSELKITESSLSEVKFLAKANALNEEIAVLMTTGKGQDEYSNYGAYKGNFAMIPSDAKVGDKFTTSYTLRGITTVDTTYVLYVGAAGEAITSPVTLENNRVYFFGAVSKGKESGSYSTFTANAEPYFTPAVLPFTDNFRKNLSTIEDDPFIGGWAGTTNFGVATSSFEVSGVVTTFEGPGEAILNIPALDFPQDSNVIVKINYSLSPYGYNSSRVEGDTICLEISTDAGRTFTTLKAVDKNTDNFILGNVIIGDYLGAKQAMLRLRVKNANTETIWNVTVSSISITALPFCPQPRAAYASLVYGGNLGLNWSAGENGETQWNISTAPEVAEGEELLWSRASLVEKKPYFFTGLGDQEVYNVRVQAVCQGGRTSAWVESKVQAGRVPSFTEDFNAIEFEDGYYGKEAVLPANWENGTYSGPYVSWYSGYAKFLEYKSKTEITEDSHDYNGSVAFDMQQNYGYVNLLRTPMVELDPAEKPSFSFDAAFGSWVNDAFVAMPAENQKDTMRLAMWLCDTANFNISNAPTREWKVGELATWNEGKTITIDLSEYVTERKVVSVFMAVYTEKASATGTNMLYLDNIGFKNTLPLARSVKVLSLSSEQATIDWVADRNVEKWLVRLTGEGIAAPRFYETTGHTQVLPDLEAEKSYTASVAYTYLSAGEVDTVAWVSVAFTTPAASCDEPTDLSVTDVTRNSAVLSWNGDAADGYRVRYRPVAADGATAFDWIETEVSGKTCTLSNLALLTEYECGVQAICNKTAELESDFVSFENFTTLNLTCFAPTNMRVIETGTKTAKVAWAGTSASYQVAWTLQGSTAWTYGEVVTDEEYTIQNLNYNTSYTFKVRGVCVPGDSSDWSETRNFRTQERPACAQPTDLRVEGLTQTSATLLWNAEEAEEGDILSYTLRHRMASVQAWDSIKGVEETTYAITGMQPKTAYVWAVMTVCADNRYSENWAQLRIETKGDDTVGIQDFAKTAGLYVTAGQGQVYVMNPQSVRIDRINIYSATGRRMETYAVRSNDNVIVTTSVRRQVAIVEIESEGRSFRFKILL